MKARLCAFSRIHRGRGQSCSMGARPKDARALRLQPNSSRNEHAHDRFHPVAAIEGCTMLRPNRLNEQAGAAPTFGSFSRSAQELSSFGADAGGEPTQNTKEA